MSSFDFNNANHFLKAYYEYLDVHERRILLKAYQRIFNLSRENFYKLLNNNLAAKANIMLFFSHAFGLPVEALFKEPEEPRRLNKDFVAKNKEKKLKAVPSH